MLIKSVRLSDCGHCVACFSQSTGRKGKKKGKGGGGRAKVNVKNSPIFLRDGDTVGVKV